MLVLRRKILSAEETRGGVWPLSLSLNMRKCKILECAYTLPVPVCTQMFNKSSVLGVRGDRFFSPDVQVWPFMHNTPVERGGFPCHQLPE